jgi:mono/diheme cytochrome c family protein
MRGRLAALGVMVVSIAGVAWGVEGPPAARWDFGAEETTPLRSHGGVHRDVPGPRPPEYPDFEPGNTAIRLDGSGAHLSLDDMGANSPLDFANRDTIALEAWVQVDDLRAGENVYVIGKGRTGAVGFAADNQNWALRVRERKGKACVSFLFATPPASGVAKSDAHWHRWTTSDGFAPGPIWHHVAVTYRFGDPSSVRGWIDGLPRPGAWDMGGPTSEAPLVDDDAVWIGSSRGGSASNSFRGALDSIAVHRQALDDASVKSRYRREGVDVVAKPVREVMPDLGPLPTGRVLATFHEGMPAHDRWPSSVEPTPREAARWETEEFLLSRLPRRYDAWGIRDGWNAPVLTRLAADVTLPSGTHRFLMRVRGLSRLWVDGTMIARSGPLTGSPNGEEPITPVAIPPHPGLRPAAHRQQEMFGEAVVGADGRCRVVLETLVGGKAFRAEPGELCVAIETSDGRSFAILTPATSDAKPLTLADAEVEAALARQEAELSAHDDRTRRAAGASQDAFWARRHEVARAWALQHPAPSPAGGTHPIDAFLAAKIDRARAEAARTPASVARQFHATVLPILRDECVRCHGEKEKGGLRLNSRESALKGGESELPALVPGNVEESELLRRVRAEDPGERMPPNGGGLKPEQIATLEDWVKSGAPWPAPPLDPAEIEIPTFIDDAAFLRRLFLDTVGVPPDEEDVRGFLADTAPDKQARAIDRVLADERVADHWMSYWQDVLAENPTLVNPSLNTTGPFRWFLYDSMRDGKPLDRLVTELILLRGNPHEGGSAGFGIAADNDAPLAAKGQIVAGAFLGIELQCARCHDSPYHSTLQRDLYALAAMFERKPVTVPRTSRVPDAFFEKKGRESLIKVTMKPGEAIPPSWPFAAVTGSPDDPSLDSLMQDPGDPRERLAALVTAPTNTRFAQVIVNRVWRRLLGAGFVEPAHDWEGHEPSHPELLEWLARELVAHDYDMRHLCRLILTSEVYRREAIGRNLLAGPERRFFAAPERRRLSAEQVVDSLYAAAGQRMDVEEITFDPDGRRPTSNRLSLGVPRRAWMFASLANERDRPSLNLPRARAVTDVMLAFGWTGSRQNPRTDRETSPNVLQPGVLANSVASVWLTRAVRGSILADAAVVAPSPVALVDRVFLRYLGRLPTVAERAPLVEALAVGFDDRLVPAEDLAMPVPPEPLPRVTWSNHLRPEATTIALELERRARIGPPFDPRLRLAWREVFEDVVWGVVNSREFVWIP